MQTLTSEPNRSSGIGLRFRLVVVLCGIVIVPAYGHELTTELALGLEYSDNFLRTSDQIAVDELVGTPSVNIDYQLDFSNINALLQYSLGRIDYRDDIANDRTDLVGEGRVTWSAIENTLSFTAYQSRSRLKIDSEQVDTPENKTERRVLQVGPTWQIRPSRTGSIQLSMFFVDSSFDADQLIESTQVVTQATYGHRFSSTFTLGVEGMSSKVKFSQSGFDYTNQRIGLNGTTNYRASNLTFNVGRNKVDRESGAGFQGLYYSLNFSVDQPGYQWSINFNRELTDSTSGLALNGNVGSALDNGDTNFDTPGIVDRRRIEFSLVKRFSRSVFDAAYFQDSQDFQDSVEQAEQASGIRVHFGYELSPRLDIGIRRSWLKGEYDDEATLDFSEQERNFELSYQINRRMNLDLVLTRQHREAAGRTIYRERSVTLNLAYVL